MRPLPILLLALCGCRSSPSASGDLDLLVRGGRVVDGSGNPSFLGDVGVRDGRIVSVGRLQGRPARRVLDAAGLVVAPGFVDIHDHSDSALLVEGDAPSMVRQGVTSLILGEGESMAPSREYPRFGDYFARLRGKVAVNVGSYVGSSQVWDTVHGLRAGPPSADERARMKALVAQAMADGALGVSSSLSGPPGSWIDTDTLVAMSEAAAAGGGIYATHMRNEGSEVWTSVAEALEIGRRAGLPVEIIHLKIAEHTLWGKMPDLIATLTAARARGQEVQANVYPYRAGQNNLATLVPPWAHEGGTGDMLARLRDPAQRHRIEQEITTGLPGWYDHYTATGSWEGMLLVSLRNPRYKRFEGRRMSEVIATLGGRPFDVLFQLLTDNGGSIPTVYFHHAEEDMRYALAQPFISVGSDGAALKTEGPLSGGNPHPRSYGTFARVLARYVREEKLITLEDAVRKMSSANAAKVHQYDRGLVRPGQWADLVLFDPAKIADHATYERPHQYATGVAYVVVAGQVVLDHGRPTGARPGQILYGPGKRP